MPGMTVVTARFAGLAHRKGRIAFGRDADLVVFDDAATQTVTPNGVHHRHKVTPYLGETLRGVAEKTNGSYHEADSKEELRAVYADIGTSVGYVNERADISARYIGLALIIAMATALASMLWFSRIP